ncbi:MFS transporter [Oceanobacillus neutriphilus]|uniref:MFS transporter n=1 Tax=Oceanobacillus neutriphilus TaxID=531815 RepID=A0ABQ2P0A9_9BACI|nr:MFS transporter [Oceanobacillus neutriphilus]GGP14835.1 MFS transporter [Oceanobacillus neutriphilus]
MEELPLKQESAEAGREKSLFKNRSFLFLWIAGLFSGLSISIIMFAQAWYVVQILNMEASLGLVYIAMAIARLIFMAVGGVLADRMSRSLIMFLSDFSRALLLIGLVAVLLTGQVSLWPFISFAFIFGVLDAFFWPSGNSLIPSIVSESQLTRANSIIQMTYQLTTIVGPLIAGFVIAWWDFSFVFGMTAGLLFTGGILIYFVKAKPVNSEHSDLDKGMFESIKEGFDYVSQSSVLLAFILKTLFLNLFFTGPFIVGVPIFVKNILKGDTLDYSYLEGSLAIGMVSGSFLIAMMNLRVKRGPVSLASQGLMALCLLCLSQTIFLWQSLISGFLLGIFMMISNISAVSAIQNVAQKDKIGRVMSLQTMASIGLTPISYGITSLALSFGLSIDWIMLTGAICLIACTALLYWRVPAIRKID